MTKKKRTVTRIRITEKQGIAVDFKQRYDAKGTMAYGSLRLAASPDDEFTNGISGVKAYLLEAVGDLRMVEANKKMLDKFSEKELTALVTRVMASSFKDVHIESIKLNYDQEGALVSGQVTGYKINRVGDKVKLEGPIINVHATSYGFEQQFGEALSVLSECANAFLNGSYTDLPVEEEEEEAPKARKKKGADAELEEDENLFESDAKLKVA